MRRALRPFVFVAMLALAGCGHGINSVAASGEPIEPPTTTAPSTSAPVPSFTLVNGKPHFATPEDAMTYLAAAWNANDLVSLKHVTNPAARDELNAMHTEATNLRFNHCEVTGGENADGETTCYFDHDYPTPASHDTAVKMLGESAGQAVFLAGPADTPGWYMTVFQSCG